MEVAHGKKSQLKLLRGITSTFSFLILCSSQFLYCCDKTLTKRNMERRGFVCFIGLLLRKPKQEFNARVWRNNPGGILLTGLLLLDCSTTFLIESLPTCTGMALPTEDWAFLHQCNVPSRKYSTDQSDGGHSSIISLFSRCVKLTTRISHHTMYPLMSAANLFKR